jgi:hypothetical protein
VKDLSVESFEVGDDGRHDRRDGVVAVKDGLQALEQVAGRLENVPALY